MEIFISAGDISGEMHAARLAAELKRSGPAVRITSLGGEKLKAASDNFILDLTKFGGFGFWQPFKLYFRLKSVLRDITSRWDRGPRPDKVVLVDYYGFNIRLAAEACKRSIPVYYYISPQVWASRAGRIRKLAKYVRKMLVILPFEEELYGKAGVDAVFVGHPLLDTIPAPLEKGESGNKNIIGLFPGSRPSVIKKHLPIMLESAKLIAAKLPCEFILFASHNARAMLSIPGIKTVVDEDFAERRKLDFAITVSGTVSLENTLLGIPMAVMYKLSWFNYYLAKTLVRIPYITMANILLNRMAVPELIQGDANPRRISRTVADILGDSARTAELRKSLLSIREMLGKPGAAGRAAGIILND
jgi:lipid-A-disaccharide synthase